MPPRSGAPTPQTPVQVAGLTGASQVSAGGQFSLAVVYAPPSIIG